MQFLSDFSDFRPWSGAVSAYERIISECGVDALENALEQIFEGCETPTATAINDLLWFDAGTVYSVLGMKPDDTHERTLADVLEAWQAENERYGYKGIRAEIADGETVRIIYAEEAEEGETPEEQAEDLDAEDVAGLFGDDEGEIDEDAGTVETWAAA